MQTEFRAIVQSEYGTPEKVLRIAKRQLKSEELGVDDVLVRVESLLEGFGYAVVDLGTLREGGLIQQAGGPLAGRDFLERGKFHK